MAKYFSDWETWSHPWSLFRAWPSVPSVSLASRFFGQNCLSVWEIAANCATQIVGEIGGPPRTGRDFSVESRRSGERESLESIDRTSASIWCPKTGAAASRRLLSPYLPLFPPRSAPASSRTVRDRAGGSFHLLPPHCRAWQRILLSRCGTKQLASREQLFVKPEENNERTNNVGETKEYARCEIKEPDRQRRNRSRAHSVVREIFRAWLRFHARGA